MRSNGRSKDASGAEQSTLDMGPLRDDVGFQVHITRRVVWAALRPSRRKAKDRAPSGFISTLLLIGANSGVSPSQIAQALAIDMPNMALIMRMLEEQQLVAREVNPQDRRRHSLSLTPAGRKRFAEVNRRNDAHSRKIRSKLTDEEVATLVKLLGKVRASALSSDDEEAL